VNRISGMHVGRAQSKSKRRFLTVALALLAAVLLLPLLLVVQLFSQRLVPAFSATTQIDQLDTTIEIDLYSTSPIGKAEFARYLTVRTPEGTIKREMSGDWGGATRTSLYLTEDGQIAILGPANDDYLVSLKPPNITNRFARASEGWAYLGAFDFVTHISTTGRHTRTFALIAPVDQRECIPIMGDFEPGRHRSFAYQRSCPSLTAR